MAGGLTDHIWTVRELLIVVISSPYTNRERKEHREAGRDGFPHICNPDVCCPPGGAKRDDDGQSDARHPYMQRVSTRTEGTSHFRCLRLKPEEHPAWKARQIPLLKKR